MERRFAALGLSLVLVVGLSALGLGKARSARAQAPSDPNQVAAKVERAPLYLTAPDRYRIPSLLEPLRRVQVMAPFDGVLKSLALPIGATVREGQELGQMDSAESIARSRVAQAVVKERQAETDSTKEMVAKGDLGRLELTVHEARLDAAKAEAELAQIALDRCVLRAPFGGRILAVPVSAGQYLPKGSFVIDLADTTSLRALIPVDRTAVQVGSKLNVMIEGKGIPATVQAVLPLDESRSVMRELAAPLAAAWVIISNTDNALEPGQRVVSPYMPNAPIASVASYAIKQDDQGVSLVQVVRAERVTDVRVRVIGALGPDRSQVTGLFRPSDILIQSSSVPLVAGTFIRFNDAGPSAGVEGAPPSPDLVGEPASVGNPRIAPIGAPEATPPPRKGSTTKPSTKAAPKGEVVPF